MGSSFFTDIAGFVQQEAALVAAGRWLDVNGWVALGAVALALIILGRALAATRRRLRRLGRRAVMTVLFFSMIAVYYVATLAYGLVWFWIYREIRIYFAYEQQLELAIATVGAALLTLALGSRILRPWRPSAPVSYAGTAAVARGPR